MIGAHVQPLAKDSSLRWVDAFTSPDCFGLVPSSYDTTNTVTGVSRSTVAPKPTRVDRGIEFAMRHDMNLLRRLAD